MSEGLEDSDGQVTVTVSEDGYCIMSMKQGEDGIEMTQEVDGEPATKRLRLQVQEDGDHLGIIQHMGDVQDGSELHVVQDTTDLQVVEDTTGMQIIQGASDLQVVQDGSDLQVVQEGGDLVMNGHTDLQIVQGEIQDGADGHVMETQIIQEPQEINMADGMVVEEVVQQLPPPQYQNLIIQHMDIAEPLATLKQLLELRLQCSLSGHQFYLQDSIPLDTDKSLVEQCVQGDGMVQINLEVKSQPGLRPKINILDILKPAEEVDANEFEQAQSAAVPQPSPTKVVVPLQDETQSITRWIVDQNFRREQERLKIPFDPMQWSELHVKHWIQWAVKEFGLVGVRTDFFSMNGQELCELSHPDFIKYIPNDKGDIFWTHLELLRKCKFVAVMQQPAPQALTTITVATSGKKWKQKSGRSPRITGDHGFSPGNRTGNNGQIQLWQFLLELLTDKDCREVIQWVGDEGEFKLNNPEMVAQLWGQRKNKPTMNYEKLSRALRYYYDGDMIAKVHGKRFVYKFVCDLKMLLGYSAAELNRQVQMCAEKKLQRVRETLRPTSSKPKIELKIMTQSVQGVQTGD